MCDYSHSGFITYLGRSLPTLLNTRTHSNYDSIFMLCLYSTRSKRVNNASVTSFSLRNISKQRYPASSLCLCRKASGTNCPNKHEGKQLNFQRFLTYLLDGLRRLQKCSFSLFVLFLDEIFLILVLSLENPTKCRAKFSSDGFGTATLGRNKRKKELCYTS